MHPAEEKIINSIKNNERIDFDSKKNLLLLPLGTFSKEFYSAPNVKQYCEKNDDWEEFKFRLALEEYITSERSQAFLKNIETAILKLPSPLNCFIDNGIIQNKKAGTYLMPVSVELIRQVYSLEDAALIKLFQKHFPIPPSRIFNDTQIPQVIREHELSTAEILQKVDLKTLEPIILKTQRHIRMQIRHQEEVQRIAQRDEWFLKDTHMSDEERKESKKNKKIPEKIYQWSEELLQDANTPYTPKCAPELSARIIAAARQVAAFSTVKHITSQGALQNIFDEALYGRRTLMDFYLPFKPASLWPSDILNGDGNVICLGPQDIDPKANGGIIIEFDLPKLIKNKPAAFYKQRDLEYEQDKIRSVPLGDQTIYFDHTGFVRCAEPTSTYLKIFNSEGGGAKNFAQASKSSFIAYNLEQMHHILTLNFFRFMDKMEDVNRKPDPAYIDSFYQKVSQLTDEELLRFLTELEKNMTDTAEFNFYGAHRIDFSTIISINARYKKFSLHLHEFILALNQGELNQLRRARAKIPELFQSYRFIDYLLANVQHTEVRYYLDDARKQCKTPNWVQYIPLLVPEGIKLNWANEKKA